MYSLILDGLLSSDTFAFLLFSLGDRLQLVESPQILLPFSVCLITLDGWSWLEMSVSVKDGVYIYDSI